MRAQLVHLSGPLRGRTRTHIEKNILIGSDPDAHCRLPAASGVQRRHAEIAWSQEACAFYLRALSGDVLVNHRQVTEVQLQDGDRIELGVGGPRLGFRVYVPPGAVCKPVRRMLADAGQVAQESGLFAFTSSFARDLLTHATWQLKVFFPLAVLAAALPLAWVAGWLGARRPVRAFEEQVRARTAAVERIHEQLARGVGLVHAVYALHLPPDPDVAGRRFLLDSNGRRQDVEYTGSAFLVDRARGLLVTNRHVVRPWAHDDHLQPLLQLGFEPVFVHFTVTFPGLEPLPADAAGARVQSDDLDVAVVRIDPTALADVPELPLRDDPPRRGEHVWVLGYPTGVRALLGKASREVVERVTRGTDPTMTDVIQRLAEERAVRPTITQGTVGDVGERRMVYNADTTLGGSGGPVVDDDGRVVGVNFAIMPDFTGSNFGVPVSWARSLLD